MFSLFLAILASSSIAWIFKVTEGGNYNRYRVTTANYGIAFTVSLILFLNSIWQQKQAFHLFCDTQNENSATSKLRIVT